MRSPYRFVAAAVLVASVASVACGAPASDDAAVSDGALTGAVRKGDEFVRCWSTSNGTADEFFRVYDVKCRVSSAGLAGLSGSSVYVDVTTHGGNVTGGRPGETPGQDVSVGRLHKSDFPLSLRIYGSWSATAHDSLTSYRVNVPAAETATEAAPVIVKMPFDTWPVTFLNHSAFAVVTSAQYTVQAAPFVTDNDESSTKTTFLTSASTGAVREPRASLEMIAPPSGGIAVEVQAGHGNFRGTINGPGTYVIDDTSLRLATAEEEAAVASASGSDAGPAPGVDGGPATPPADAAPPPPATTCGGPGQMHCVNGGAWSCLAGTRVETPSGLCVPCGNDGQTYCYTDANNTSQSSAWKCNAGTRYDATSRACTACGNDGQTYCYTDANNTSQNSAWKCNAGTRYDATARACIACGAAGQTHCYSDPNNVSQNSSWTCNAGLRLVNGSCVL